MIARQFFAAFALTIVVGTCSPQANFLERSVTVEGRVYRYRVWLPPRYTKLRRWPVILFLHGSGERGNDNLRQLTVGLPALLTRDRARYRAVVVVPQCPLGHEWYGEIETQALAALDASIKEFRGDRRRVYLTGISMGGAGVWFLARHRSRWAAVVPVCGEVVRERDDPFPIEPPPEVAKLLRAPDPYDAFASAIGSTPTWIFHGADDPVISPDQSRRMFAALRARHGNVRYTEYPGLGHDAWDRAYDEPELAKWLLAQRLK
ncbi:MAG TPA: prolyl oligopeptidase family serine peptidase [Thermoanaerobaculia bacterium]